MYCVLLLFKFLRTLKTFKEIVIIIKKRGLVFIDGLFNFYDVKIRLIIVIIQIKLVKVFGERLNQHSIRAVSKFLKSRNIKSFKFYNLTMNKNIKHNKKVHVNQFTFIYNYNNIITNGTNMILNRKLLVIKL